MDQLLGAAPAPAGNAAGAAQSSQTQSQGEAAGAAKTESNTPSSALGQITGGAADANKAAGTTAADASKAAGNAAAGAAGNAASGAAGAAGAGGGLMSLGSQFQSIGLSPDMATKFAPVMQQYLSTKGGPGVANSFASAVGLGGGQ
jgi:hypothetical protein